MTAFKIERGIPLPSVQPEGLSATLMRMQEGESVMVPSGTVRSLYNQITIARKAGGRFASRKVPGGRRIWCLVPVPGGGK